MKIVFLLCSLLYVTALSASNSRNLRVIHYIYESSENRENQSLLTDSQRKSEQLVLRAKSLYTSDPIMYELKYQFLQSC